MYYIFSFVIGIENRFVHFLYFNVFQSKCIIVMHIMQIFWISSKICGIFFQLVNSLSLIHLNLFVGSGLLIAHPYKLQHPDK